ncbi:acetate--CoA ligase family protein [Nisaea acidiphila]|uniref:Acetate--CoA ligase family protein n=1 Tax=Nisaea acidiphila TaxID=1862145 RepID=A0A9J7ATX1_9PROT|nr:acetate--CoA ligase family protein [Nisaea acidiphila]UUX48829.1 acetate--CoA ligase family protein [Nisaea acidiphila]
MRPGLERLFRPKSIAVIGGGAWCANVVSECAKIGFGGAVWPVHPKRSEVAGRTAYASIEDLPGAPDATFIGINRHATVEAVRALAARGAGGAVCFASGFSEALAETGDGADLQAELIEAAGELAVLGPNCYGILNYLDGVALWPDLHGGRHVERGVAIVAQSSNIAINLTMQQRGLPIAYMATVGNQAQTSLAEIAEALLADDRVTALGFYIEGVGDLAAFAAMARKAAELGKPLVALKVGRSEEARAGAVSHTASLSGGHAGASALLQRLGIAEVRSLSAFLETLKLLHVAGPLASNRIASMSCSGGEAGMMADTALGFDLGYPPLMGDQMRDLGEALGPKVALANPLDYHTYIWGDTDATARTFSAMMRGAADFGLAVLDFPRAGLGSVADWEKVIDAVEMTVAETGKPMGVLASLPENLPEKIAEKIMARGIAPLAGLDDALAAVEAAAFVGRARLADHAPLPPLPPKDSRVVGEGDAKRLLAGFGVPVPGSVEAACGGLATAAAEVGYPLVLKGLGLAHKSEAGAVALGIDGEAALMDAARGMSADRFLVEPMIGGAVAELLVGVTLDPAHGYLLTLAAGGTKTEILDDSTCLLLPVTAEDIDTALSCLRMAPLLDGYRGASAADRGAIVRAVLAVQDFVTAHAERIEEVEINPLLCLENGAMAVDALIRMGDEE